MITAQYARQRLGGGDVDCGDPAQADGGGHDHRMRLAGLVEFAGIRARARSPSPRRRPAAAVCRSAFTLPLPPFESARTNVRWSSSILKPLPDSGLAPATASGAPSASVAWLAGWPTSAASHGARGATAWCQRRRRQGAPARITPASISSAAADRDQGEFVGRAVAHLEVARPLCVGGRRGTNTSTISSPGLSVCSRCGVSPGRR